MANLPAGVTVSGNVTIVGGSGVLTLTGNNTTVYTTVSTLTLTIAGVTSGAFTLTIAGDPFYSTADIAAINAMISSNGLMWTVAPSSGLAVPANWDVEWSGADGDRNRRIIGIDVSGEGLKGSLALTALTALEHADCSNNSLTSVNVSGLASLAYLDCSHNWLADESKVIGLRSITEMIFDPQDAPPVPEPTDTMMIMYVAIAALAAAGVAVAVVLLRRRK